jgi:hypothetical protein
MGLHWRYSLGLVGIVFVALLGITLVHWRRLRISRRKSWEELLSQLVSVDRQAIEVVALDAVLPSGERRTDEKARELGRREIWNFLGGMDGMDRIANNSRVLIEMATYLHHWHPEALDTAEELRLEARKLEWHVDRLRAAQRNKCLELHFHFYGQNAAISYYLMLQRLFVLYAHSRRELFGELQKSL